MKKIIFCLAMMLLVVSCGKPESQKSFEKFMGIIQSGDAKQYDKYMKELGHDEVKLEQKMLEALNRPDLKYESTELTVTMIKKDNKWIISPDDFENSKFMAILTGSLYKLEN